MATEPIKNLGWLHEKVQRYLNFNSAQTDQDFAGSSNDAFAIIDDFINEAYVTEYNEARQEVGVDYFRETVTDTWPQSQLLYILPSPLQSDSLLDLTDITNSPRGTPLLPQSKDAQTRIFWKDNKTLQYDTTGPGSTMTLELGYLGQPSQMKDELDEPYLIPNSFRWLLVWSACIIGRALGDEAPPQFWVTRRDEQREQYHLALSKGKPLTSGPPRIRNRRLNRFR